MGKGGNKRLISKIYNTSGQSVWDLQGEPLQISYRSDANIVSYLKYGCIYITMLTNYFGDMVYFRRVNQR